jgi:PAS domain S-box-containing protein
MLDYTGKTKKELKGKGWQEIIFPEDKESTIKKWQHCIETGEDYKMESRLRREDGSYQWYLSRAIAQTDNRGNITAWVGSHTNIEEQKDAEERKDEFISIASHELKTPLTTAKGYIELLLLEFNEENEAPFLYVNKAHKAINRLSGLVGELLDAGKIQNGKLEYSFSTFDFNELMDETIMDIQHTVTSHQLIKKGTVPSQITADQERLKQVIINFLTNAIKYSPKADEVLVKVEKRDKMLQVSVRDYGLGIDKKHLKNIFERYYRVEEHAQDYQGMGIGLYISFDIVKRHKGKIWAESKPGEGTVFYFQVLID